MKQFIQQLSAPRKQPSPRTPMSRTWFAGHDYTKVPDGILPRTYYIKVTKEHPEGVIVNEYGQKLVVRKLNKCKGVHSVYYVLKISYKRKTYDVLMHYIVFCTFHHIPKNGNQIDHIDGNSLNNHPDNLREVTPAINRRDGGFCKHARNRGVDPAWYPIPVILRYYEIIAEFKATHTRYDYKRLTEDDLRGFMQQAMKQVSGREYQFDDPHALSDRDISRHQE